MKTLCISLFALLVSCVFPAKALSSTDPAYAKAMNEVLVQLDTANTVQGLQKCKNAFERIAQLDAEQWMPLYYVAYCDIQSAIANPRSDKAEQFLVNGKQILDKLRANKAADPSEIETLVGLHSMGMIQLNPQANGQIYFKDVIGSFCKAVEMNPENPRPRTLLLFFNAKLPDFVKEQMNEQEEMEITTALFEKEEKGIDRPYWGKVFLQMLQK